MAEFTIAVTQEEKDAVVAAIQQLLQIPHLKKMSQAMIADTAGIKASKVRAILQDLIDEKTVMQYAATDNPKLQRYIYVVNSPATESSSAEE